MLLVGLVSFNSIRILLEHKLTRVSQSLSIFYEKLSPFCKIILFNKTNTNQIGQVIKIPYCVKIK